MPDPYPPGTPPPFSPPGSTGRPAGRAPTGRLLGLGLSAALRASWAVPLQAAVLWLGRAVVWTPAVIAFGIARDALDEGLDPLGAVARAATAPGVLLPTAGLAVTLGLLAAAGHAALWAGLSGALAGAARRHGRLPPAAVFPAALAETFPRFLALGAAVAVGAVAWFGALFSLLLAGAKLYLDAIEEGRGGAPAAAALAVGGALYLAGTPVLGLVARLAAARVATGTRSALAAIHEASGQLLRRPFALVGGVLAIRIVAGVAAAIVAGPAALLPPAPLPLLAMRLAFEGAADLVLAFALVAELAFLVAAAVDDREGLPSPRRGCREFRCTCRGPSRRGSAGRGPIQTCETGCESAGPRFEFGTYPCVSRGVNGSRWRLRFPEAERFHGFQGRSGRKFSSPSPRRGPRDWLLRAGAR